MSRGRENNRTERVTVSEMGATSSSSSSAQRDSRCEEDADAAEQRTAEASDAADDTVRSAKPGFCYTQMLCEVSEASSLHVNMRDVPRNSEMLT